MAEFNFRPPQLSDREWAVKLLAESDFRGCLYTFGNNYVWRMPITRKYAGSKISTC